MQAAVVAGAPLDPDQVLLRCPSYHAQVFSAVDRRASGFAWMTWILFSRGILARSFKLEAVEGSWEICVVLRIKPLGRSPHTEVALVCWSEGHPKGFDHSMLLRITQGQHDRTLRLWLL
ncbi:hypothetical protein Ddc_17866 [Ditylenchus destructor]|nr:hypothetical protein Ddc_17866 [Ditylenchus destructor]